MEDVITVLNGIYSEYAGRLFSYGMQLCPDKRLVEDALQETFLDLGRHARAFSQARDKRGYLFASFRYKLLRMKKEHPEYSSIDGPDGLDLPQEGNSSSIVLESGPTNLETILSSTRFSA